MHTVELLEEALRAAEELGYEVRQEWLGGTGGGPCEVRGKRILFIDLSLPYPEQLDQASQALEEATTLPLPLLLSPALHKVVAARKAG